MHGSSSNVEPATKTYLSKTNAWLNSEPTLEAAEVARSKLLSRQSGASQDEATDIAAALSAIELYRTSQFKRMYEPHQQGE